MIRISHLILGGADVTAKTRAKTMMEEHRKGKGEFYTFGQMALLRWPATNRRGEGDGHWTTVISGVLGVCSCPSFQLSRTRKPCKHMVLAARLALYNAQQDAKAAEKEESAKMVVCTG